MGSPNRQTATISITVTVDGMEQAAQALDAKAMTKMRNIMHALGVTHLRIDGLCIAGQAEAAKAFEAAIIKEPA